MSRAPSRLTEAARAMLREAGCTEIADDYVILHNSDITILLSDIAVEDLNRQAADRDDSH